MKIGPYDYDPDTGVFIKAGGVVAGTINRRGYRVIRWDNKLVLAHRLSWFAMTGTWPREIDHVDGDKDNNRRSNLREATRSQNMANANGTTAASGMRGVYASKGGRWRTSITVMYQQIHLGIFATTEEASSAYRDARVKYFGEFSP